MTRSDVDIPTFHGRHVLVTGGLGFIGGCLSARLLRAGARVRSLWYRPLSGRSTPNGLELVHGDIRVNSPVTTAGCMASMNAGILLGIVLSQLVREGSAVAVPGWNGGPYNLQTMVGNYALADEQGVPTSMGKFYDLPVFGLGGSTDSNVLDQQCGFEITLSLMTALLHGANIVHDVGFMDAGMQCSLQVIAMSNETLGFLRAATAGVTVNEETLALDVIEELGPTGSYLGHDHTLRHYKEPFYSKLLDKNPYSVWEKRGATTMEQRATKMVDDIIAKHQVAPLAEDVQKAIHQIVEREQAGLD